MRRLGFLLCAVLACRKATPVHRIGPITPVATMWKAQPGALPLDGILEVMIDDAVVAAGRRHAALLVLDSTGRRLAPPLSFSSTGGKPHVVTAFRSWAPWAGAPRAFVVRGRSDVERATASLPPAGDIAGELRRRGFAVDAVAFAAPVLDVAFSADKLHRAEAGLGGGDPRAIVATLDELRGAAPTEIAATVDAVAAEAAFAWGRTQLAHDLAVRGLAASPGPAVERRLLRIDIAALSEALLPIDVDLQRLHAASIPDESLEDAALELRLAEMHDRTERGPRRAPAAARALVSLASAAVDGRVLPHSGILCRAGSRLTGKDRDAALARGKALAEGAGRIADAAMCWIRSGDAAIGEDALDRAETEYARARDVLGSFALPREQREAWFSAAFLAEARKMPELAFSRAATACEHVDRLLAVERDLGARESLLSNVLGYFGMAERLGILAHHASDAILLGERGKGRAFGLLTAFGGNVDASARGSWFDANEVAAVGARLDEHLEPDEVALTYTLLARNAKGVAELAIGVVAREGIEGRLVPVPSDLRDLIEKHADAIERSDEPRVRELGARLHAILIAPVADRLANKRRILLSPHLRLHRVSFAALHDGTSWLVERHELARIPPLPFYRGRRPGAPRAWLSAIAPPHPPLGALPGFEAIADELGARLRPAVDLRGTAVTPSRLLGALGKSDALFYAGHAQYVPESPLRSALLVASGEIRAADVLRLHASLEVVVLVGCETARLVKGRASYSDDAIGLPRAFLAAGARSVVGANGPVLDRDAEDFSRALLAVPIVDLAERVAQAQRCLISGKCPSRGVATWASYLVDVR